MFIRIPVALCLLAAITFLYLAWEKDESYAIWMAPFLIVAALLYVLGPQINWWWYSKYPPALPAPLKRILEERHPVYRRLTASEQQRFRERLELFRMAVDWTPMAWPQDEAVPHDVQYAVSAAGVVMTLGKESFLFPSFEKVIVYPKPFLSPEYPFPHASELYEPDNCLIFSAEQALRSFVEPTQWYNTSLHEYARAFILMYPNETYPKFDPDLFWERLQEVAGFTRQYIEATIGLAGVDPLPTAMNHYWLFRDGFEKVFPEETKILDAVFLAQNQM